VATVGPWVYERAGRAPDATSGLASLGPVHALPSSVVAALTLVVGYAVAAATGIRALGGLVLLAGLAVCWVLWRDRAGTSTAVSLVVAFGVVFAASHLLALAIGAWPSVLVVSALMAGLAWLLADRRAPVSSGSPG
jgi:hypothetical protein